MWGRRVRRCRLERGLETEADAQWKDRRVTEKVTEKIADRVAYKVAEMFDYM